MTFIRKSDLTSHSKIHKTKTRFECTLCHQIVTSAYALKAHIQPRTGERPFRCTICNKSFKQRKYLRSHESSHSAVKLYTCEECQCKFKTRNNLAQHMRLHSGVKAYTCEICTKKFALRTNMQGHIKAVHLKLKEHECNLRSKQFVHKNALVIHVRVHTSEKPLKCHKCFTAFSRPNSLKKTYGNLSYVNK